MDLQGRISQLPTEGLIWAKQPQAVERYHRVIDELEKITTKDYGMYRIMWKNIPTVVREDRTTYASGVYYADLREQMMALIRRLHAEFFRDEPEPFGERPPVALSMNQQQIQNTQIEMLFGFRDFVQQRMDKFEEGSKERTLLQKIYGALSGVRDGVGLVKLVLDTGNQLGTTAADIARALFGP